MGHVVDARAEAGGDRRNIDLTCASQRRCVHALCCGAAVPPVGYGYGQ